MVHTTPEQALEKLAKLERALNDRVQPIEKYERYYEGTHDLRFATRKFREAYGSLFREFADNYCGLVVDTAVERMTIEGFRFPTEKSKEEEKETLESAAAKQAEMHRAMAMAAARQAAQNQRPMGGASAPATRETQDTPPPTPGNAAGGDTSGASAVEEHASKKSLEEAEQRIDTEYSESQEAGAPHEALADSDAWEIWQRNNLDLMADIAHEQMFIAGVSYLIVGPQDDGNTDNPLITVEHPMEVITSVIPGTTVRNGAIKRWYDEEEDLWMCTLYLPDSIWKLQSHTKAAQLPETGIQWVEREGVSTVMDNPFQDFQGRGVVPVVPLVNRQKLNGKGLSELKDIIPLQDVINKTYNDALVASEFAAFRQRILTGMEVPEDENGNIIPDFDLKASVQRLMLIKDKDVGVHEFQISDLTQYVSLMTHTRSEIAALSRTPPQYLTGTINNVAGDALKAAESGHVAKIRRRSKFCGEGWEEAMRLAFFLKGNEYREKAESYDAETIWKDPEFQTTGALMDSLAKLATLGVPAQALWEKAGASQTEIARWQKMLVDNPLALPPQALAAMLQAGGRLAE